LAYRKAIHKQVTIRLTLTQQQKVNDMTTQSRIKSLLTVGIFTVIILVGYYVFTAPDRRNAGEKISDAISALPNGVDKAARQLENRTPAEKLKDAAKDVGNDIKKSTNQQ